jgi:hypothetical protein
MQTQLLENIIRKFLFEQGGKLTIDLAKVTSRDTNFFKKQIAPLIKTDTSYTAKDAGLVHMKLVRTGGRTKVDDMKLSSYDTKQILDDAINYLSRSQGPLLSTLTTSDFIWLLVIDPHSESSDKEEQMRAKYSVLAVYIRKSLLSKQPRGKTSSGWLDTLSRGSNVYDMNRIKQSEWVTTNIGTDKPSLGGDTLETVNDLPLTQLSYGNTYFSNPTALNLLYGYFESNFAELGFTNIRDDKKSLGFGCELKSIIEQFQEDQNIPVTGEWNTETRKAAMRLGKIEYITPNITKLKSKYTNCKLKNLDLQNIKYPAGGAFTPENTKEWNIEFVKVQTLMLDYIVTHTKTEKLPISKEWYKQLQSKSGIYSTELIPGIKTIRGIVGLTPDVDITSELIEKIR